MTLTHNQLIKIFNPKKFNIHLNTNFCEIRSLKFPNKWIYICTDEFYTSYSQFWSFSERKNCKVVSNSFTKILIKETYIKNLLRTRSLNILLND
jgi:hypothetical protein